MDELRESSLLFSLQGLLETERERVQREAREAERRREEELERVAQAAERRRSAARQEREARERRRRLEQEREQLEQQRIESMQRATVERARVEAEGRLRLVEVEQSRAHERALVELRERSRTAHFRGLSWLSFGALVLSLSGGGLAYFGYVAPAQSAREGRLEALLAQATADQRGTLRELATERGKTRELLTELSAQADEATPPAPPRTETTPHRAAVGGPRRGSRVTPPAPPVTPDCPDNGDPLAGCLRPRRPR